MGEQFSRVGVGEMSSPELGVSPGIIRISSPGIGGISRSGIGGFGWIFKPGSHLGPFILSSELLVIAN